MMLPVGVETDTEPLLMHPPPDTGVSTGCSSKGFLFFTLAGAITQPSRTLNRRREQRGLIRQVSPGASLGVVKNGAQR